MDKQKELKEDIAELESFLSQAKRPKVKDLLSLEIRKLVTQVTSCEPQPNTQAEPVKTAAKRRCQVRLNNYAWDQSNKFVKFYVTLKNINAIPSQNIVCNFTNRSLELSVTDLDGKDYILTINKLLRAINPEKSSWKVKTDMVVINAAKDKEENWSHVTELEEKASQLKKMPEIDKSEDPTSGLMSLMKNLYDSGDDEMKRTIAKAWSESQDKRVNM